MEEQNQDKIFEDSCDPLVRGLSKVIIVGIKLLLILMALVFLWSLVDVVYHIYQQFHISIDSAFSVESLFSTLGSILVVLITVEIFLNIAFLLTKDKISVSLVLATALTAIARKVIILDYTTTSSVHIFSMACLVLTVGLTYWLIAKKSS